MFPHAMTYFTHFQLVSGSGYNYKAVSRWTTKRKLGYDLIDCDIVRFPLFVRSICIVQFD